MAVVPLTAVLVIIVPDVSVEVPDGIAEVDVVMLVSVLIVPVVPVMLVSEVDIVELVVPVSVAVVALVSVVLLVFVSFLQAYPKKASATMVRRTRNVFFILSPLDECFSVKLMSNSVVASGLPALTSFPLDVFPFGKKTVRFVGGGGVGQRTTTPEETQQHKCQK